MKTIPRILVSLVFASQCVAAEQLPLVHAKTSPLVLTRVERTNGIYAEFRGRIWVTGTLLAEWYGDNADQPEYLLIPDLKSSKRLPHFARYGVRWVEVVNGKDAFGRAGGTRVAVRHSEGEIRTLKITGSFEVSNYVVGVDCDSPWARAVVVRVNMPDQRLVAALNSPERC